MFSWIPFFSEMASKVLSYEARQSELIAMLREAGVRAGLTDRDKDGKGFPLNVIDPFTFVSLVMKHGPAKRIPILTVLKKRLGIEASPPEDFDGVPSAYPLAS